MLLRLFEQHGNFIRSHLEFSYIATSNHYLSDVVGLLWLGISLPELERANQWQTFGIREVLREMDKQILADGADHESSTGYHRFVLELFLFTFILCRLNSIDIEQEYRQKLRLMLEYLRAYLRPDGRAPIVGDTDSGQVMPIVQHPADDHAYLLALGAVLFNDPGFRVEDRPPEELFWLFGEEGLDWFAELVATDDSKSAGFDDAGMYVLRDRDLYLLLNASGSGLNGRGAHGHNDALSVEVSACGSNFLCDPGTFVYTGDLEQRHLFRSTHYHSTVEVDNTEQNTTDKKTPFRIGDEAQPHVLHWKTGEDLELVVAEHYGYRRLAKGEITHQRAVMFHRRERYWLIEDRLTGSGRHQFSFIFHFAPEVEITENRCVFAELHDRRTGARLLISSLDLNEPPTFEQRWFSPDYGARVPTIAACLRIEADAPLVARWLLLPIGAEED
ncbi:MAG: alginate lyase family protein, partial [Pyrinomonadaceae bacterium]